MVQLKFKTRLIVGWLVTITSQTSVGQDSIRRIDLDANHVNSFDALDAASDVSPLAPNSIDTTASKSDTFQPEKDSKTSKKPKTLEERLENWGRLHKDDKNSVIQEFWLLGRYHGQQHWSEGSEGRDIDWENRRYRMGGQARMFEKLTLHAQMVSGSDFEPFYNGFTELWAQWALCDELAITVGQQKHRFTHDRNVSSRYLNTLERGLLLNMFGADYTPAVTLSGRTDKVNYYTGIFSNATERNMWDAFTELNSGYSLLAASYFDVGEYFRGDTAHFGVSYLFSDANENATNLNVFEQGISNVLILTQGPCSLVSEGLVGLNSSRGDAYGVNIQPGYFITDQLQLATRYQYAASEEGDGLLAQRRYEREAGLTRGDRYHAVYAGLNYYLAGHRIKFMNGLEYADLDGQNLWTASFAFRMFWGPHSKGPFPMAQTLKAR
jgi:phosphate-selective porin OprO and OprP